MKYLKKYESLLKDQIYKERIELVEQIVSEMKTNPIEVYQELYDMFLPHIDNGIKLEDIELVTINENSTHTIYYPLDKKPHPLYGFSGKSSVDIKIVNSLNKDPKAYYLISFGYDDAFTASKHIQNVDYSSLVDWEDDSLDYIYLLVKDSAKEVWERFNKLYSVKLLLSETFIPMLNDDNWQKCDPFGSGFLGTKIIWIVEINP